MTAVGGNRGAQHTHAVAHTHTYAAHRHAPAHALASHAYEAVHLTHEIRISPFYPFPLATSPSPSSLRVGILPGVAPFCSNGTHPPSAGFNSQSNPTTRHACSPAAGHKFKSGARLDEASMRVCSRWQPW